MEFETVEEVDVNDKDTTEEEQLTVIDDVDDGSDPNKENSIDEQRSHLEEDLDDEEDDEEDEDLDQSGSVTPSTSISSRSGIKLLLLFIVYIMLHKVLLKQPHHTLIYEYNLIH